MIDVVIVGVVIALAASSLVEIARHSTAAQLEKICRLFAQSQPRPSGREEPERWLRVRDTDDGMVRIGVQLRPEEAARLLEALQISAETRLEGLLAMAEAALRGDHVDRPPVEVMVHKIRAGPATWTLDDQTLSSPSTIGRPSPRRRQRPSHRGRRRLSVARSKPLRGS